MDSRIRHFLTVSRLCARAESAGTASNGNATAGLAQQLGISLVAAAVDRECEKCELVLGQHLFEALRAQDPHIKVLLMTGYPLDEDTQQTFTEGLVDWLLKPIMPAQLALAVNRGLR